jgi:hypothetical protein
MRCQAANDQQLVAGELPLQTQEAFVVTGLDEFMNDGGGGGEAGFDAMLAGRQADTDGDMGFTDTAGAQRDDVLAAIDELRAGQVQDQFLVERGDRIEVEALQAFNGRELGRFDAPVDHARLAVDQFQFDQPRQITDMIDILGRALPGQLLILPEHGW